MNLKIKESVYISLKQYFEEFNSTCKYISSNKGMLPLHIADFNLATQFRGLLVEEKANEDVQMIFNISTDNKVSLTETTPDFTDFMDNYKSLNVKEVIGTVNHLTPKGFRFLYTKLMNNKHVYEAQFLEEEYHKNIDEIIKTKTFEELMQYYYGGLINGVKLIERSSYFNILKDTLEKEAKNELTINLVYERLFADTQKNVVANINSLLDFRENFKGKLTIKQQEDIALLKEIRDNVEKMKFENIEKIISKYSNLSIQAILYDTLSSAKYTVAESYKNEMSNLDNFRQEVKNGVKLIYADKNPYKIILSITHFFRNPSSPQNPEDFNLTKSRTFDLQSCSAVSNDSLFTYLSLRHSVAVGYTSFDPHLLQAVTYRDNYTEFKRDEPSGSYIPNDFPTFDQLLDYSRRTKNYNEIDFINFANPQKTENALGKETFDKVSKMEPSCIVVLDAPTEYEIEVAKRTNLPLFVLNEQTYIMSREQNRPYWEYDRTL